MSAESRTMTTTLKIFTITFWHFSITLLTMSEAQETCYVVTAQGAVRGSVMTSFHGINFCSYRGIPYAAPPVGNLRFRNPQPAVEWTGELNATKEGNQCLQGIMSIYFGDEDCLYLNVHTPKLTEANVELRPVMMFIHGGAFLLGNGRTHNYGPHYLVDKDVVFVTINYRLGVLGFLSTGDDAAPGNFALKDQVEAMTWVKNNIEVFGGDPNKMTILGESAGSMSVHFHILSPLSKGLFHRGIGDSGSALMPLFIRSEGMLSQAQRQAEAVGCPTVSSEELVSCLRYKDIDTLMTNQINDYNIIWRPVVEVQSSSNSKPFLAVTPQDAIKSGDFNRVPFLLGTNAHEGSLFLIPFIGTQEAMNSLNRNIDTLGASAFFLGESVGEALISETWKNITDFYLGSDHTVHSDNVYKLINAATDRFMQHNVEKTVQLHIEAGHDSIYLYNFAYRGKYSFLTKARYDDGKYDLGVLHIDELEYYLSSGMSVNKWNVGHPDLEVLDSVVTLWTNFAIYGNPTPAKQRAPQDVFWPTADSNEGSVTYYVFENDEPPAEPIDGIMPLRIRVVPDKFKDRMDFWNSLPLKENLDAKRN